MSVEFQSDQRSTIKGLLAETPFFANGAELHFREYIDLSTPEPRHMYAYHYQDADAQLIFRYDNAAHRLALRAREHKHTLDSIVVMLPPTLERSIFPLRLQFENALQMVAGKVPPIGYALPAFFAMSAATSGAQSSWRK